MEVKELRQAERLVAASALPGSFGAHEIAVLNIGESGAMLAHAQPMRIGTVARLSLRYADVVIATTARVVWSRFAKNEGGEPYQTGLQMQKTPEVCDAIGALVARGVLHHDRDSLARKKKRLEEREKVRTGQTIRYIIPAEPEVPHEQALLVEHARTRLGTSDAMVIFEYLQQTVELATIEKVLARKVSS